MRLGLHSEMQLRRHVCILVTIASFQPISNDCIVGTTFSDAHDSRNPQIDKEFAKEGRCKGRFASAGSAIPMIMANLIGMQSLTTIEIDCLYEGCENDESLKGVSKSTQKTKNIKKKKSALFDITNCSQIVGLANLLGNTQGFPTIVMGNLQESRSHRQRLKKKESFDVL
nr:hypothetical protein [Tanacetum cinerariifolium]